MSARRTGFYSGSFDPLTFGHLDVLTSAVRLCDRLVVAIGVHPGKAPLLSQAARAQMIREVASDIAAAAGCELEVASFDDLSVAAARRHGAAIMIRGLRDGTDLDYEMQLAGMNAAMAPDVHTIFIPATGRSRHITSTLVRQIALMGGDITAFVPSSIARALVELTERRRQPAVPD